MLCLKFHTHVSSAMLALALCGCHFEGRVDSSSSAQLNAESSSGEPTDSQERPSSPTSANDADADGAKPATPPTAAELMKDATGLPGNLVFAPGKSTLEAKSGAEEILTSLKAFLDQQPRVTLLRIEGHADNKESLQLSGERALTVKKWLIAKGVPEARLLAVGFASSKPIADNAAADGRAQNRRVEFEIAKVDDRNYLDDDPLAGGTEFK